MKLSLLQNLDKKTSDEIKGAFASALPFRKAVVSNLRNKITQERKKTHKENFFLEGDFAQKMAYSLGYEKAQEEFIALMEEKSLK